MLWRALAPRVSHEVGFYIDVGDFDPDHDSVTRVFYDRGWHGVNAEPVAALFQPFPERRPRDVNLMVAVSDQPGEVLFHEVIGHQLGTVVDKYALDFNRFRPWVLVIEATEPNRMDVLTHDEWESDVLNAGYSFVYSHDPNRYYIANEHSEIASVFGAPPDEYELALDVKRREDMEREVESLRHDKQRYQGMEQEVEALRLEVATLKARCTELSQRKWKFPGFGTPAS